MLEDEDLDNIRKEKKFISLLDELKAYEPLTLLKNSSKYVKNGNDSLPEFVYQDAEDNCLQNVRTYFNLDSVAGDGDEISKILNILHFVHNAIKHSGSNFALCEFDAIDIYNYYKTTGKGVNCRHLAIALNEMYLSMGIPSRYVPSLSNSGLPLRYFTQKPRLNCDILHEYKKWNAVFCIMSGAEICGSARSV